ncbi:diaminopimelate decarboxylase [Desulfobotulus sp. H1]|uniref:Diaminopimelate decarboxylase n=1 Tax=Desulfobotulus pelophilus TaxID=2823377 RepID=A0ABT3N8Q3_9BACT|nr:diaminopimelate decarboxylase [Desulfobotulus pelophilus]MCW7753837.1 diaminopimelate decarboxylase [Desulfobotulus pelophilus]
MPMPSAFQNRLFPKLTDIAQHFATPFHIYDEKGILETGASLKQQFSSIPGFREYFAVKALPNPSILKLMQSMGFGFDCSSIAELALARSIGARAEDILFTSNNTSPEDFSAALADGGCILNLDDISLIPKVPEMPETICFRYNPGPRRTGNAIIGNPVEAKYGITHEQVIPAYQMAMERGVKHFGLHTMVVSNERNHAYMVETARMLLSLAADLLTSLGLRLSFLNIGGGLGIPYRPEEDALDIASMGVEITELFREFKEKHGYMPALLMESGRYMTGPHGVLVTRAINRKDTYRHYVGVDACMSALMRPGMYGAYHHIEVLNKQASPQDKPVDVVGSLCENNDKFAIQRPLPPIEEGDILIIHDTGAHGHAMGFNYNGQLRPQELLLRQDGSTARIRRKETLDDLFATLHFEETILRP